MSPLDPVATLGASASAQVTAWPQRLLLTAATVAVIVVVVALLAKGWRRRARTQHDVPPPRTEPLAAVEAPQVSPGSSATDAATVLAPCPGRYLASTRAGDWLDRLVVHGLGVPSRAELIVSRSGVWWQREGARDVFVPASDVVSARLDRGIAGAVYEDGGVVVVTWRLGGVVVDTGFRAQQFDRHEEIVDAVQGLVGASAKATGDAA
jgi:hypothetical protein